MAILNINPATANERADADLRAMSDPNPYVPGQNQTYPQGAVPKPMQYPDMSRAFMTSLQNIEKALQQGGISDAELGDANLDRPGIWFTQMWTIRSRRMKPRIDAISLMYSKLVQLAMRQYRKFGIIPKLTEQAKEYNLPDPAKVKIKYRLMQDDKVMEVVRRAEAVSMQGILSQYDILKDIMHHEDPDGAMDRLLSEEARRLSPVAFWRDKAKRAADMADRSSGDEKKQYLEDMRTYIDEMERAIIKNKLEIASLINATKQAIQPAQAMPQPTQLQPPKRGNSQALMAIGMLGEGGNGKNPVEAEVVNG